MSPIIAGLIQTLMQRTTQVEGLGEQLLAALCTAVEKGDVAELRQMIRDEQARTVADLEQVQAVEIPD